MRVLSFRRAMALPVILLAVALVLPAASLHSAGTGGERTVDMTGDAPTTSYTGTVTAPERMIFQLTGSLNAGLQDYSVTLQDTGKVLVAGGSDGGGNSLTSAELYDPATGLWTPTGGLNTARRQHIAILLNGGKVLVAGGVGLTSAELYDPTTSTWSPTGSMATARRGATATRLGNGKVLLAGGGDNSGNVLASAELYDPTAGTWAATGSLLTARWVHTATLMTNGQVLVAAGMGSNAVTSAELYDPVSGTWAATSSPGTDRGVCTATLLQSGKVLLAGGYNSASFESFSSAQLYDPDTGTWSSTGSMATARAFHTATLLINSEVLVAGNLFSDSTSAELYHPATGTWSAIGNLNVGRYGHAAIRLSNGKVLLMGGAGAGSSAEVASYLPTNTFSATLTLPADWSANPVALHIVGSMTGAALDAFALSNDGTTWGPWLPAAANTPLNTTWDVGTTGGNRTVYLRARDVNGQYAEIVSGTMYDTGAPSGTVVINGGATTSTSPTVTLTLSATDALTSVADMSFSNDGSGWSAWQPYANSASWTLSSGDGIKTVYARFRDLAGNVSAPATAEIVLDTGSGTSYGVSINSAALFTNSTNVTLTLTAPAGTNQMIVSNDGGFGGSNWEAYSIHKQWTITAYGAYVIPRIVYARFRTNGIESSLFQDDIILDVNPPTGSIAIVGATAARSRMASPLDPTPVARLYLPMVARPGFVQLSLWATDDVSGVAQMQIGNDADFTGSTWEPYATTKIWPVPSSGRPTYSVYAHFRDYAGNVSVTYSADGTR